MHGYVIVFKAACASRLVGMNFTLKLDKVIDYKIVPTINKYVFRAAFKTLGDDTKTIQLSAWEVQATEANALLAGNTDAVLFFLILNVPIYRSFGSKIVLYSR